MCWRCELAGLTDPGSRTFLAEEARESAAALPIEIAALLRSAAPGWNGVNGSPQTVTFSFAADRLAGGPYGRLAADEWGAFDAVQAASARQALQAWAAVSGVRFLEVADTAAGLGVDIRFNLATLEPDVVGQAGYPRWGEVWLDLPTYRGVSLAPGTSGFQVLLHEVGHALGFKHPFEDGAVLPLAQDNTDNTVMSYTWMSAPRSVVGPYDAAAARHVYGTPEQGDAVPLRWTFDPFASAVRVTGTDGDDTVRAPDYPRTILALGGGTDTAVGSTGRDWIAPGTGAGNVDGGRGVDTLETPAARLRATLTFTSGTPAAAEGGGTVVSRTGTLSGGGADIAFRAVENFAFLDGRLVFDPNDPIAQASRLYQAALGRAPDPDGLNFQAAALEHGAGLAEVARGFAQSAEYAARYVTPDAAGFVRLLYNNALGRQAPEADVGYHVSRLAAGAAREQVLADFSESPENRARAANGLAAGLWDQDEDAASVARLYRAVLDRAPDEAGTRFHLASLERGATLQLVAEGFTAGPEFAARFGEADAVGLVVRLYRNTLGREPDAEGVAYHVGRLVGGAERGEVLLGFSESPEFHARTMAAIEGGIVFA